MAKLYHSTCYDSRWQRLLRWVGLREKRMPRFIYHLPPDRPRGPTHRAVDELTHTQTFVCDTCGDRIHFDTDWLDSDGGFIGNAVSERKASK